MAEFSTIPLTVGRMVPRAAFNELSKAIVSRLAVIGYNGGAFTIYNNSSGADDATVEVHYKRFEGEEATTASADKSLTDTGKFTGYDLAGKICVITESDGGNTGEFTIKSNTDNKLTFFPTITGEEGITEWTRLYDLSFPQPFVGIDLTGLICTITESTGGNLGDFVITENNDDTLLFDWDPENNPGAGTDVHYTIANPDPGDGTDVHYVVTYPGFGFEEMTLIVTGGANAGKSKIELFVTPYQTIAMLIGAIIALNKGWVVALKYGGTFVSWGVGLSLLLMC